MNTFNHKYFNRSYISKLLLSAQDQLADYHYLRKREPLNRVRKYSNELDRISQNHIDENFSASSKQLNLLLDNYDNAILSNDPDEFPDHSEIIASVERVSPV